jgi:hypothetical protein
VSASLPGPDSEGASPDGSTKIMNHSFRPEDDPMSESTTLIAPATAARKTPAEPLFEPVRLGRHYLPHRMVMAPLIRSRARPARKRAICSQCLLLRAKGLGGSHRDRSDPSVAAGTGLCLDARHSQPRTSRGLAPRHRRGAQGRRPDLPAALARWTHLASVAAARRHASGRALGHQASRGGIHRE